MPPRPRYHRTSRWTWERGEDIRAAARTLVRLLGPEPHHDEWRDGGWNPRQPGSWRPSTGPRRFGDTPSGGRFRHTPDRQRWRPYFGRDRRPEENWKPTSRPVPRRDWRSRALPRRGPPVTAIKVPRRYQQGLLEERRPRGEQPRGPLRGGPERSAHEPQRKPRGGLCGGPKGQPRKHRPHPREHPSKVPTGKRPGKSGKRRDPPSSRPETVDRNEGGGCSHEPMRGELAASSRT